MQPAAKGTELPLLFPVCS